MFIIQLNFFVVYHIYPALKTYINFPKYTKFACNYKNYIRKLIL